MRKVLLPIAIIAFSICSGFSLRAQNIYTFAGIANSNGYTGDDSLATLARLNGPGGITTSPAGAVYFADNRNNVIRTVSLTGIITTLAGTGAPGYSGDGAAASAAKLKGPRGIAIDAAGNLYVSDTRNNVVRKITTAGIISTVAGNGTAGYSGDGGPATNATFREPVGVAVDATGNLFICDSRNYVVRTVSPSGIISTIAGNNTAGYSGDAAPATDAQLNVPLGIADVSGTLYIADSRNNVIRTVSPSGVINTFAGNGMIGYSGDGGLATAANLYAPADVKVDAAGNVFISDSNNVVRIVNGGDTIRTFAGSGVAGYSGDGGPATAAKMSGPGGLAIDAAHNVYISTTGNNVIRRVGAPVTGIYITSNTGIDTVCIGTGTIFTATPIAYATPHYQWQLNGTNVGTDATTYTPGTLAPGDIIDCILEAASGGTELAMSNNIHMDSLGRTGTINGPNHFCVGSNATERDLGGPPPGVGHWASSNTAVATISPGGLLNALTIGTTTVYFIISNVCGTDSASYTVTVGANTIAAITGPAIVCQGQTVTYTDVTPAGLWRTRNGPFGIIDSVTGSFTAGHILGPDFIIYGTSRSCYRVDTIMIDSLPVNAPISGPTVVDSSWTITLTDPNTGGIWSSSDITIATVDSLTGIVTGVASGTVTITYTITIPGGCSNDTTYTIVVSPGTAVHNVGLNNSFTVFPNPSSGTLNIQWTNQAITNGDVTISDATGRQVYTSAIKMNTHSGNTQLDISALKTGIYLLTVKSEQGFYTSKLIVE